MFQVAIRLFGGTLLLRTHVNTEAGYSAANKTRISIRAAKLVSGFFLFVFSIRFSEFALSLSFTSLLRGWSTLWCSPVHWSCALNWSAQLRGSGDNSFGKRPSQDGLTHLWHGSWVEVDSRMVFVEMDWNGTTVQMRKIHNDTWYTMTHTHILYLDCACRISFEMTLPGLQELRKTRLSIRLTLPCWRCLAS